MTYQLVLTGKFKKGLKLAKRRGLDIVLLESVVEKLLHGIALEEKNMDHELKGKFKGFRECHIQPDWLLILKSIAFRAVLFIQNSSFFVQINNQNHHF